MNNAPPRQKHFSSAQLYTTPTKRRALSESLKDQHRPLRIELVGPGELRGDPRNARVHSERQIQKLAASIGAFGFTNPVLVDGQNRIIAGHCRLAAALRLGLSEVPIIRIMHLTRDQRRALAISDNRIAEESEWNLALLAEELQHLSQVNFDFDVELTGFDTPEIDVILSEKASPQRDDPADEIPAAPSQAGGVTKAGDIWILGAHRILCGDALLEQNYRMLMRAELAQMAFTDFPYNVRVNGHVGGRGKIKHREFEQASGEMTSAEFTEFLTTAYTRMKNATTDGALVYGFMDWRHLPEILAAGTKILGPMKNLCCWVKSNAGQGSFYRSQHELVTVFKNGAGSHRNNIELGKHGRNRSNVWEYAGVNTFKPGRMDELSAHPTVKPIALVMDAIKDCTRRADIVLDPFGGSGTTLLAAERTSRKARLIEIDPLYVDVTITRWQKLTGKTARLAGGQLTFDDLCQKQAAA